MRFNLAALFLFGCAVLHAQAGESLPHGWANEPTKDPMTDKAYVGYVNTGNLLNGDTKAHISFLCTGGKLWRAVFSVDGMGFHADFYASLRNAEVTYAAIKVGRKIDHKGFLLSRDMQQASLSREEVKTLLRAATPIIQFSDTFGTSHYATFDMSNPPDQLAADCGDLAK
jgi:hypothetical protein